MAAILFVRIKSNLDDKELEKRMLERKPKFLEIPGLAQKFYGYDATAMPGAVFIFLNQKKRWLILAHRSWLRQFLPLMKRWKFAGKFMICSIRYGRKTVR